MPRSDRQRPQAEGSPSFKGRVASSKRASFVASRIRKTNSKAEVALRAALWSRGLRYRKNVRSLPGAPDVVFIRERVALFCDGDFWHGRRWKTRKQKLLAGSNAAYWVAKIERNRARDVEVSRKLRAAGWTVMRLWETDVLRDPDGAAERIADVLSQVCAGLSRSTR